MSNQKHNETKSVDRHETAARELLATCAAAYLGNQWRSDNIEISAKILEKYFPGRYGDGKRVENLIPVIPTLPQ